MRYKDFKLTLSQKKIAAYFYVLFVIKKKTKATIVL